MKYLLDTSVFVHLVEQRWSALSINQINLLKDSSNVKCIAVRWGLNVLLPHDSTKDN